MNKNPEQNSGYFIYLINKIFSILFAKLKIISYIYIMKEQDLNPEIFNFKKNEIERYMLRTMNISKKFKKSFAYVFDKLMPMNSKGKKALLTNPKLDLSKLTWSEGKSYYWIALTDNIKNPLVQLLIRRYGSHYTVFFKYKYKITDNTELDDFLYTRFGVFTFFTNTDNMSDDEHDSCIDDRFKQINAYLPEIIKLMKEDNVHGLWNSYSLKLESEKQRPKYIEVKNIWDGDDSIGSIDDLIFAVEELFQKNLEIFATNDMIDKIKTMKVGDKVGRYEVLGITTEVKNDYYHAVGLTLNGSIGSGDKEKFTDVYSLTRWYYEGVFNIPEEA
jgi:hypothetical protein